MTPATADRAGRAGLALVVSVAVLMAGLVVSGSAERPVGVDPAAQVAVWEVGRMPPPVVEPPAPTRVGPDAVPEPDVRWLSAVARRTGIGPRALRAYAVADLRLSAEDPRCKISWVTLSGIGWVESRHGSIGNRRLGPDGRPGPTPIVGVPLSGAGPVALVLDSDQGRLDGDTRYDRAIGPMQFIPRTWQLWGRDGDGDTVADPHDLDDAAYSAARLLCSSGRPLDSPDGWMRAVLSYNASGRYLRDVLSATNTYASRAGG